MINILDRSYPGLHSWYELHIWIALGFVDNVCQLILSRFASNRATASGLLLRESQDHLILCKFCLRKLTAFLLLDSPDQLICFVFSFIMLYSKCITFEFSHSTLQLILSSFNKRKVTKPFLFGKKDNISFTETGAENVFLPEAKNLFCSYWNLNKLIYCKK